MSQKGIKVLVSLETAFWIVDTEESTSREETEIPLWLPGTALLAQPALEFQMNSQTWPGNRKTRCEYGTAHTAPLMYGNTSYGERLHVLSSMVPSYCVGERAQPSLARRAIGCYHVWCLVYGD